MAEFSWKEYPINESWNRYFQNKLGNQVLNCSADTVSRDCIYGKTDCIIVTQQSLKEKITNPNANFFFLSEKSWYGGYFNQDYTAYADTPIVKKYNCLMNRLEVHRQSCFYELYISNLLDQGNVSMLCEVREDINANKKHAWKNLHDQYNSCFDYCVNDVLPLIPFRNFDKDRHIYEVIASTAYSVILETTVDRPDSISFTEKTLRALQIPRPFLLMCSTGSIAYLRHLGFNVFDDFVDHSYDNLPTGENAMLRLVAIVDQLKYLCQQPITHAVLQEWKKIYLHNIKLLKSMSENFTENFSVIDNVYSYLYNKN